MRRKLEARPPDQDEMAEWARLARGGCIWAAIAHGQWTRNFNLGEDNSPCRDDPKTQRWWQRGYDNPDPFMDGEVEAEPEPAPVPARKPAPEPKPVAKTRWEQRADLFG